MNLSKSLLQKVKGTVVFHKAIHDMVTTATFEVNRYVPKNVLIKS